MVIVRLNDWDEFLAELRASTRADRVVRLTFSARYDLEGATASLTMVAGYLDADTIVEFVDHLGLQPQVSEGARATDLKTLLEARKKSLESNGFVVRPGRYHPPSPPPR